MAARNWRFWAWPWELARAQVLGINARNLRLIGPLNPRENVARADDKLLTKEICRSCGVPVPQTYAVIERPHQTRLLPRLVEGRPSFVVKPACGCGGRGVLAVRQWDPSGYRTCGGDAISPDQMRHHLARILSGLYSLGGRPDRAIVERLIADHPEMIALCGAGTPDVRILIHRGRPVLAMLRLPTRRSGGRANLHQGAVAVGVDLQTGRAGRALLGARTLERHPDTGRDIGGFQVPCWPQMLQMATRLGEALGLGFAGIDLALDGREGPLLLEANARPGLTIQLANARGLAFCS